MPRVMVVPVGGAETVRRLLGEFNVSLRGRRVFIKVNAVDFRKGCYTSPEAIGAAVDAAYELGASEVLVMENSTQGNFTRLVFRVTGIADVLKRKGAKPIYLDEERSVRVKVGELQVKLPKVVYKSLIEDRDGFYLNMPKLKTHDMTKVTLSLKNQLGFLYHDDRRIHHSRFELHKLIADLYSLIKPDFVIVDGRHATVHGHYPLEKMLDRYIVPVGVYIAGDDALAVDITAARILGYDVSEVEHLKLADEKHKVSGRIEVIGDISRFNRRYPHKHIGVYPEGVKIVKGKERACEEGCVDNTLMVLEMLHVDYGGRGEFSIVFGKGLDRKELEDLKPPVLIVGPCAVEEAGDFLKKRYRKVVEVPYCNDLAAVLTALMKFMKLKATQLVPIPATSLIAEWIKAKLHGSTAHTPPLF